MICIYACLSTRPDIWCEFVGIAYCPASAMFGRVMCAASSLPCVRSAPVTLITRCCLLNLLTFDEFEHVMRAVKTVLMLGNNELKLTTNMHLVDDDPWR